MIALCHHIKSDGKRCGSPALRKTSFCYFHSRPRRKPKARPIPPAWPLKLPLLDDHTAIRLALAQVLNALSSSAIDAQQAGRYLRGLQLAAHILEPPSFALRALTLPDHGDEPGAPGLDSETWETQNSISLPKSSAGLPTGCSEDLPAPRNS